MGRGLTVFDAYRPYPVTEKIWEAIKDDRYVAVGETHGLMHLVAVQPRRG